MKDDETDPVFIEALEWFTRMQDAAMSSEERKLLAEWLSEDPAHATAYERAGRLWNRFGIVKPEYERMRRSDAMTRRSILLGATGFLVAGTGAWMVTRPGMLADHTTGIGERQTFTLPDGSTVELDSYSALSVHYKAHERRLILHRGQGFFSVASDTTRPFIVEAEGGTVQALGTQFDIKLADEGATVTVIEHSVLVTTSGHPPVTLEEGWQVSYGQTGMTLSPRTVDTGAAQSWRQGRIVFEDVPLRRVLRELERYRRGKIILMDNGIGDIPVTAIFETDHADAALGIIASTLPVRVVDAAGFVAIVYRR